MTSITQGITSTFYLELYLLFLKRCLFDLSNLSCCLHPYMQDQRMILSDVPVCCWTPISLTKAAFSLPGCCTQTRGYITIPRFALVTESTFQPDAPVPQLVSHSDLDLLLKPLRSLNSGHLGCCSDVFLHPVSSGSLEVQCLFKLCTIRFETGLNWFLKA